MKIRVIRGEYYVVFQAGKRRVTAANTSFSLHYKDTKFEAQSQVFCVLFSRERTLFFTTEYTEFHGVFFIHSLLPVSSFIVILSIAKDLNT